MVSAVGEGVVEGMEQEDEFAREVAVFALSAKEVSRSC